MSPNLAHKSHLFTSFVVFENCSESIKNFYSQELIPLWVQIHLSFFETVHVVTNIPSYFKEQRGLKVHSITLNEAFCNYDYSKINVTASQLGSWIYFLNTIEEGEVAIYMDPDAFMLNNRLQITSKKVKDHELTRIISIDRICDAGVSVLRNTKNTKKMLHDMTEILSNNDIVNHIEVYYHNRFKGQKDFFIKWSSHSLLLRDEICGINSIPDTIHDCVEVNIENLILSEEAKKMLELIRKKKLIRKNYLPER